MMNKQYEVNAFCTGMIVGINLYQQKVITAQKNNEAIRIDGELYYQCYWSRYCCVGYAITRHKAIW